MLLALFLPKIPKEIQQLRNHARRDQIHVITDTTLQPSLIRIDWNLAFFKSRPIYQNEEVLFRKFHDEGEHQFHLYYANRFLGTVVHVKPKKYEQHRYTFTFSKLDSFISVSLEIEGPSPTKKWLHKPNCN